MKAEDETKLDLKFWKFMAGLLFVAGLVTGGKLAGYVNTCGASVDPLKQIEEQQTAHQAQQNVDRFFKSAPH